jgi:hypothetical protein
MNLIAALPACLHASLSAFGMTRGEGSIRACIIRAGWTRKERREAGSTIPPIRFAKKTKILFTNLL